MIFVITTGLLVAFAAPMLHRKLGRFVFIPMVLLPLAMFVYFSTLLPAVLDGQVLMQRYSWAPSLGLNLDFRLDGLSLFFAMLISGFGTLIILYASGYLKKNVLLGRFYLYLSLFMTAMLGLVTSDNIIGLFVFWELTSISSYLLIGFQHEQEAARTSAWQALLVTGAGGLALFAGLLLLGIASNSYSFTELLSHSAIRSHQLYLPALLLILLGCFTKSAQFPFHFWLPNAMVAPTPVSAYLHSATMVKAGIYLLARLAPVLGDTVAWHILLVAVGSITALLGAFMALQHTDLKAILAYTTISALGLMVSMLGVGTELALQGVLVFLLAHALYKGTLFLVAGAVDHSTGTREIHALEGLGINIRLVGVAATLAAFSMAGILPFLGFVGKELLYEAALHNSITQAVVFTVTFISGTVFVAVALLLSYRLFWKKAKAPTPLANYPTVKLYLPPLILSIAGLLFGMFPQFLTSPLLQQASRSITGNPALQLELSIWHGFTIILALSILTLVFGFFLYHAMSHIHRVSPKLKTLYKYGPNNFYHLCHAGFLKGATIFISNLQSGYLRSYLSIIILMFIALLFAVVFRLEPELVLVDRLQQIQHVPFYEIVILFLIVAALIYLLNTRSRLSSIVVMGLIGYSAALFYILFGAPDVAATQLLIETLTVVIFVLLLHKLPAFLYLSHQKRKYIFGAIAVLFGTTMTYVMLLVQQHSVDSQLKNYYSKASYLEAHGRNIVNVILVDFRALDTLGEISVLAVAALGIVALLRLNPEKKK